MPTVILPDGRDLGDVPEGSLLEYYRREGATIDGVAPAVAAPVEEPKVTKGRVLKKDLVAPAEALGLDSTGTVPQLQERIAAHEQAAASEPVVEQVAAVGSPEGEQPAEQLTADPQDEHSDETPHEGEPADSEPAAY